MPKKKTKKKALSPKGKGKGAGNFAKIPFQKMSLDSMIGSKGKKAPIKSQGIFTRRSQ